MLRTILSKAESSLLGRRNESADDHVLGGRIPGGQVCRSIISHIDLLPTLASLIGESPGEKKIDGVDCLEILPQ